MIENRKFFQITLDVIIWFDRGKNMIVEFDLFDLQLRSIQLLNSINYFRVVRWR